MEKLIQFTASDLAKITNHRSGEIKFGEKMVTIPKGTDLNSFIKTTEAKYVLLGIPEDIGVRANFGRPGAASAWESTLKKESGFTVLPFATSILYWSTIS